MKTIQLKTLTLLLVELPDQARDIKVFHDIGRPYISYFVGVETFRHYTDEDVELIGKVSELPEKWFEQHVETSEFYEPQDPHTPIFIYKGYCDNVWKHTARESFYSLLEAKEQVYLGGNPCGDEAQSCTFDPERTFLFTVNA